MGFATIAMYTGLFLVVMIIIYGMGSTNMDFLKESKEIMEAEKDMVRGLEIAIINTSYLDNVTSAWLENVGQDAISMGEIDVYLSGKFIPRSNQNRSFTLNLNLDVRSPGLWNPAEELQVNITKSLLPGIHILSATAGGEPTEAEVLVGIKENDILVNTAGQWSPVLGGTALTAGELLAVNNNGGTNLTLNASSNESMGLEVENPPFAPAEVLDVIIQVYYEAPVLMDDEFIVEGHDTTYDGELLCSESFGNTTGKAEVEVDCDGITVSELENLYIVLNNTAIDGRDIYIDYVRTNTTYLR